MLCMICCCCLDVFCTLFLQNHLDTTYVNRPTTPPCVVLVWSKRSDSPSLRPWSWARAASAMGNSCWGMPCTASPHGRASYHIYGGFYDLGRDECGDGKLLQEHHLLIARTMMAHACLQFFFFFMLLNHFVKNVREKILGPAFGSEICGDRTSSPLTPPRQIWPNPWVV